MGIATIDTSTIESSTKDLGISITHTIDTGTIDTSIANIARHRVVESINTRSTRQPYAIAKNLMISITLIVVRDGVCSTFLAW
jgi:hypothetical protein